MASFHERFLDQAVVGLASDGKVVPVRLALFAEIETPALVAGNAAQRRRHGRHRRHLSGRNVQRQQCPAGHRLHQRAARAVLKSLLPPPGTDLKGHRRSDTELRDASGYARQPEEFDALLRILDTELRLVTPTEAEEPGTSARTSISSTTIFSCRPCGSGCRESSANTARAG